jgi:hypothetical protein
VFQKDIEFSTHEDYFAQKEDYPIPSKLNIPEWYKKLDHNINNLTVKGCMPFLDSLTAGYLLKMPQDFLLKHNIINEKGKKVCYQSFPMTREAGTIKAKSINLNTELSMHSVDQLKGSPYLDKNKELPFHKILNPWKIKTPPGYSCLFVPPLNNSDDRFSIIPGIVDTDQFSLEINFPIVVNGDKYPVLETTIKKGTPYVQVIPFKRDEWKMKIIPSSQKNLKNAGLFYNLTLLNRYRNKYWKKKLWN